MIKKMLKNDIFKSNFNFLFFISILYYFWSHIYNYSFFNMFLNNCRYVSKNKLTMCSIKLINRVTIKKRLLLYITH